MPRNRSFHSPAHEPFRAEDSLELRHDRITGPLSFLNPTRASFRHTTRKIQPLQDADTASTRAGKAQDPGRKLPAGDLEQPASDIEFNWRSRDNRKGRHALVVDQSSDPTSKYLVPQKTSSARAVIQGIGRMVTQYPYWDVSWLVATIFTLGSMVWVINAFFAFLPLVQPNTEFHNELLVGGGVSAFIGATIFEIGSVLLMIEVRCSRLSVFLPSEYSFEIIQHVESFSIHIPVTIAAPLLDNKTDPQCPYRL